jgi:hypothetical protein
VITSATAATAAAGTMIQSGFIAFLGWLGEGWYGFAIGWSGKGLVAAGCGALLFELAT